MVKKARRAMGDSSPRRTAESKQKAVELYRKSGTTYAEVARGAGWAATRAACPIGSRSPAPDGNPLQMAEDLRRPKRENSGSNARTRYF